MAKLERKGGHVELAVLESQFERVSVLIVEEGMQTIEGFLLSGTIDQYSVSLSYRKPYEKASLEELAVEIQFPDRNYPNHASSIWDGSIALYKGRVDVKYSFTGGCSRALLVPLFKNKRYR